jgi:hypothetical protein
MEQFSAEAFYKIGEFLGKMGELLGMSDTVGSSNDPLNLINHQGNLQIEIEGIVDLCETIDLKVSVISCEEFLTMIEEETFTIAEARSRFAELGNIIRREMQTVLFFHLPSSQAEFYDKKELFGKEVSKRFPNLESDIIEAGNCLALGRGTACVFHLMRVMETAVQEFGSFLGIEAVSEKNWQVILDGVNKAIKGLHKGSHTAALSEVAANLYSVKLAWRNEVMHPKATYTADEAKDVLRQVKLFMGNLVDILPSAHSTTIQ